MEEGKQDVRYPPDPSVTPVQSKTKSQVHFVRATVIFPICLASVFVLPYLGVFLKSDFFFFAPQFLFPYAAFAIEEKFAFRLVFSHSTAVSLTVLQWTLVGFAYVWFARRLSIGRGIITAITVIAAVGFIILAIFKLFGVSLPLDGP